jgi:hypothetical protein
LLGASLHGAWVVGLVFSRSAHSDTAKTKAVGRPRGRSLVKWKKGDYRKARLKCWECPPFSPSKLRCALVKVLIARPFQ